MLEALFNSYDKERILLYLYTHQEGYAQEIRQKLGLSLRSVQLQLKRLEDGGVLVCRTRDRTIVYQFNPRYPLAKELTTILEKVLSLLPEKDRKKYFTPRLRPRRSGKPL
ncbi:MAG: winged helix-turn-helix domain-containing protein [Pseudomonadota bacterium]